MGTSRKLVQAVILTVALGLSAVLAVGLWKSNGRKDHPPAPVTEASDAEMKLTDMEYTEMQEGKRLWTLHASEAKYFQEEQKTLLSAVHLTFFLSDGEEIQLESRHGILYAGSKNIELWDTVQAVLPRGYELSTERAFYEHQKKVITSETPLKVAGPDLDLCGTRWEYRIPDHEAVLDGGVQATVVFPPPETQSSE